jgi:signal transduction histidine kinase
VVTERTATLREREQQLARQNVQLSELDRAKSRFFANVSHEFRTPLTLTIGPLEGIADELRGVNGRVARAFDMSLRNARRLMRLVNQILDVAKLEAGQMRLNRRSLDLASFVRSIVEAFVPAAEGKAWFSTSMRRRRSAARSTATRSRRSSPTSCPTRSSSHRAAGVTITLRRRATA